MLQVRATVAAIQLRQCPCVRGGVRILPISYGGLRSYGSYGYGVPFRSAYSSRGVYSNEITTRHGVTTHREETTRHEVTLPERLMWGTEIVTSARRTARPSRISARSSVLPKRPLSVVHSSVPPKRPLSVVHSSVRLKRPLSVANVRHLRIVAAIKGTAALAPRRI